LTVRQGIDDLPSEFFGCGNPSPIEGYGHADALPLCEILIRAFGSLVIAIAFSSGH
jgi:hypothetical protein